MSRTTLDIDAPILADLKRIQRKEGKTLGRLISDLLAQALAGRKAAAEARPAFRWISRPLGLRVDLRDKDALYQALDEHFDRKRRL